jgi:hypothetical protein
MKKLLIIGFVLCLVSCKSELEIITAKKISVTPGIASGQKYSKYVISVNKKSNTTIQIDSIHINKNGKCYQPNFILVKEKSPTQLTVFSENGNYVISASLLNTKPLDSDCNIAKNGAAIYFKEGDKSKAITIRAFSEEKKSLR